MVTYIYNNSTQVVEAGKFEFKDSLCYKHEILSKNKIKKTKWNVCVCVLFSNTQEQKLRETTKHY